MQPLVGIVMGSDSDLPVMQDAAKILEQLSVPYEMTILSAHRTPERMVEYAHQAEERGLVALIAGAGGAAHLPGMVASMTDLPVIGVPIQTRTLQGLDSLLSIVQMPRGIPVATVAIQNAQNAGLLAARIVGTFQAEVREQLRAYRENMREVVTEKAERLESIGYASYLAEKE
ncbi:MAG TPA: 5-(carboxyamino)imidazole ribonucleotide mutase [Myxococcales bacterium]|nr:5-(carboxyamino)imidazole ribonucleotide mutase [Deltaproteobacteria bacterium]HAA54733.1 5-(carboxyamino)imidazole ribonucleotide mutase [Myxococcales bacterium]